ncbi:rubrerythrin [Planctomycetales bacterium]|nr:rubrerythrin [Planctomycetales bacterium]
MQSAASLAAMAVISDVAGTSLSASETKPERNNTMSVKGTKTEKNLLKAFAGESQARGRYTIYSAKASEEGYEHIAAIFLETAEQERVHAQQFFQYLEGGPLEITATYPAGKIGTTEENLAAAAGGEHEEWAELYPEFAKTAQDEGFTDVSRTFKAVAVSEKQHEKRYLAFLEHLKAGDLFKRENVIWRCRHCGYVATAPTAPGVCPACKKPQAWFEILAENW